MLHKLKVLHDTIFNAMETMERVGDALIFDSHRSKQLCRQQDDAVQTLSSAAIRPLLCVDPTRRPVPPHPCRPPLNGLAEVWQQASARCQPVVGVTRSNGSIC